MNDDDWIGCLVLVVAPELYVEQVLVAMRAVESTIFSDPVLVDLARVAQAPPDILSADPDRIAARLRRELVLFARSPARNPAPRCTFCILVLHPDAAEADLLVRNLATTAALSELPIVFRVGALLEEPGSAEADAQHPHMTRTILESITATAHEVDKTPDFSLRVDQIGAAVREPRAVPALRPTGTGTGTGTEVIVTERADRVLRQQVGVERHTPHGVVVPSAVVDEESSEPRQSAGRVAVERVTRLSGALFDKLRQRREVPTSNLEVINDLTRRTDRVALLYLVFVAEPVQPAKKNRLRRFEVAKGLIEALTVGDRDVWYVRTFTAGRELRAGRPLPELELLRRKDFPERWGEYLDLYDSAGDIIDSITMDRSSFLRRGAEAAGTTVVFLAEMPPRPEPGAAERLAGLGQDATVVWVSFGRGGTVPEDIESVNAHFLRYHEDVVEELLDAVRLEEEPDLIGEEMAAGRLHQAEK